MIYETSFVAEHAQPTKCIYTARLVGDDLDRGHTIILDPDTVEDLGHPVFINVTIERIGDQP